jgi:hypothetical protein
MKHRDRMFAGGKPFRIFSVGEISRHNNGTAGGQSLRMFSVDELLGSDDRVAIRHRQVTGLGFSGGRLFQLLEGPGF